MGSGAHKPSVLNVEIHNINIEVHVKLKV